MNRNNNWLIAILAVLAIVLLACCVLLAASAAIGWVADDAAYGPMMRDGWREGDCPGCPGGGPFVMRSWIWPVLLVVLGLLVVTALAALAAGVLVWARRSNRPRIDETRNVPRVPDIEE